MHRFLLPACVGLLLGIAWRSSFDFGWSFIGLSFCLCGVVALVLYRLRATTTMLMCTIVLLCFTAGVARMHSAVPVSSPQYSEHVSFTGTVIREVDVRDTHANIVVATDDMPGNILVRTSRYTQVSYNDVVNVRGSVRVVENFSTEHGREFNYQGYLAKDDIQHIVHFGEVHVVQTQPSVIGALLRVKHAYTSMLEKHLPEPYAALAAGITVGERRSLGDSLTGAFRDTGLIHIVVLSGYNITIVILFVSFLFSLVPRRLQFVLAILSIIAFTLVVGASATVVRAALMGGIAALGTLSGRVYDALHALIVSAFLMLLWNPYLLMYDPSFQLSFIATVGLLVGVPLLTPHLAFIPSTFHLRDIVAATIATQIAVLPLLAYLIGEVSLVALVVNVLVLPVVPLAMLCVFLLGVFGFLPVVHTVLSVVASLLLAYIVRVVEIFAAAPIVTMKLPEFSLGVLVLIYGVLSILVTLWHRQTRAGTDEKKTAPGLSPGPS